MDIIVKIFGERVKVLRTNFGLSQDQLAKKLQVSSQTISNWESDTYYPSLDVLTNIAEFFHVKTDYLLGLDDRYTVDMTDLPLEVRSHFQIMIDDYIRLAKEKQEAEVALRS